MARIDLPSRVRGREVGGDDKKAPPYCFRVKEGGCGEAVMRAKNPPSCILDKGGVVCDERWVVVAKTARSSKRRMVHVEKRMTGGEKSLPSRVRATEGWTDGLSRIRAMEGGNNTPQF